MSFFLHSRSFEVKWTDKIIRRLSMAVCRKKFTAALFVMFFTTWLAFAFVKIYGIFFKPWKVARKIETLRVRLEKKNPLKSAKHERFIKTEQLSFFRCTTPCTCNALSDTIAN